MPFDFAQAKATARRAVHTVFGVSAHYRADSVSSFTDIRARLHEATQLYGDLLSQGYAETVEAADRIVVIPSDHQGLTFKRGGEVTFDHRPGITFVLEIKDTSDGPLEEVWQVTRKA